MRGGLLLCLGRRSRGLAHVGTVTQALHQRHRAYADEGEKQRDAGDDQQRHAANAPQGRPEGKRQQHPQSAPARDKGGSGKVSVILEIGRGDILPHAVRAGTAAVVHVDVAHIIHQVPVAINPCEQRQQRRQGQIQNGSHDEGVKAHIALGGDTGGGAPGEGQDGHHPVKAAAQAQRRIFEHLEGSGGGLQRQPQEGEKAKHQKQATHDKQHQAATVGGLNGLFGFLPGCRQICTTSIISCQARRR